MFNFIRSGVFCLLSGACLLLDAGRTAIAANSNADKAISAFVNNDTFAVVYLDVGSVPTSGNLVGRIDEVLKLPSDVKDWAVGLLMVEGFLKRIQTAGGEGIYALAGLGDVHIGGGPLVVISARSEKDAEGVERELKAMVQEFVDNRSAVDTRTIAKQVEVRRKGELILAGMKSTVERYTTSKPETRADLLAPLVKVVNDDALVAAVFCPGPDFRRVVRELWPELPGVLAPLKGELADRWLALEAAVNLPPNANPHLALQAKDPEAAETFAQLWRDLPTATTQFGANDQTSKQVKGYAQLLVSTLPARVAGTRVEIGIPTEISQLVGLGSMFSEAADKSMEVSWHKQRMQQFKELLLGMLNYESARKLLPAAAIRDKDGKPLLSWRVAILPYLDEMKLYKEFNLEEPWDSPHNRPLVEKMPAIYADPTRALKSLARAGKTTYQVPLGAETAFFQNEGSPYREIKDGTSNTVLLVEVDPSQAVEWTKPDDWHVDLAHPRQGLERTDRKFSSLGFADGHVLSVEPSKVEEGWLRGVMTRAGGEASDH